VPTWHNLCGEKEDIFKRLDRFLDIEALLSIIIIVNSMVSEGGISDHQPIVLGMKIGTESPLAPLKFNQVWLEEEDFIYLRMKDFIARHNVEKKFR
jgi:hypothetical protein